MSGLEKLTQSILDEANENAAGIVSDAENECEKIKKDSDNKCADIKRAASEETDKKEAQLKEASVSAAALIKKQEILRTKRRIIDSVTDKVKQRLYSLDSEKYFETLLRLAKKTAHGGEEGQMLLNADDKKRLPKGFEKDIAALGLSLSEADAQLKGGFILKYGGIEENCSFDAVLDSASDTVTDIVSNELFR